MLGVTVLIVYTVVLNTHGQINKENDNKIKWTIKTFPIVFGKNATLFCNLSNTDHCCTNTVTWMKDSYVILHRGASTNSSKYQQITEKDGYSLVIKLFDEKDINCQYTCLYEFYTYSSILQITANDFILYPTNETTKHTINPTSNQLVVDLNFSKVLPSPQCEILMNNRTLASECVKNESRNGLFLSSHVKLTCELKSDDCSGNITVQCLVGPTPMIINETTIPIDCRVSDVNNKIIIAVLVIAVFTISAIALVIIIYRKKLHSVSICVNLEVDRDRNLREPLLLLRDVYQSPHCSIEIISEHFHARFIVWMPAQRSKDVINLLKDELMEDLFWLFKDINYKIHQFRVKIWIANMRNLNQIFIEYDNCSGKEKQYVYSKNIRNIKRIINIAIATDDRNMLLTSCNNRINSARLLLWKEQNENRGDGPRMFGSNKIKNDNDLIFAIGTFAKSNARYCLLMIGNIKINKARRTIYKQ